MMVSLFYDILLMIPVALTSSSLVYTFIIKDANPAVWIAVTLIVSFYMLLMKHLKLKGRGILLGTAVSLALAVLIVLPSGERIGYLTDHIWFLWELAVAFFCFILGTFARYYRKLRIMLIAAGLISLPVMLVLGKSLPKLTVCLLFFYALLTIADEFQRHTFKKGDPQPEKHLVFVSPFILLIFVATALLKAPDSPYDWGFIRAVSQKLKSGYAMLQESLLSANGWDSDSPVIGFSDRGGFGGDLTQNDYPVMDIYSSAESDPMLYLAGRTFDSFNGKSWEKTDTDTINEKGYDTLETVCAALDNAGDEYLTDLLKPASFRIKYSDIRTTYVFSPAKLAASLGDSLVMDGGDMRFSGKKQAKEPYRIYYYRMNRGNPAFEKMLATGHEVTPSSFENAMKKSGIQGLDHDGYLSYRDMLYETYLEDPELSVGLKSYIDGILTGADTDYEKLLRIEELLKGFSYSDSPGKLPESVTDESSFLDYFILEKREGYCSYFATSFVLLARAYGIPARYVQGFRVPAGNRSHTEVLSSSAHAWPEAYINGIGWFAFEPTPGLQSTVSWETVQETVDEEHGSEATEDTNLNVDPTEAITDESKDKAAVSIHWYHIVIPLLSGIMLTLLLFLADGIIKKRRYKKMNYKDKCLSLCHRNLDLLRKVKAGRMTQETITEYRERISNQIPGEYLAFCPLYEEILYSDKIASADDVRFMEDSYLQLKKYIKERRRFIFFLR
ncbi:MAG: transglutaminase domain-containing protein [Lachnospiraceae bacterium]|nr:transglutaminase domain-containing protein [Lachnospiraceae bacterium]